MRAKGMQVLTNQIKEKLPGITIYGIGDDAHKKRVSGHNEDDTSGVRAEDQDADDTPEHRAIDVMVRNKVEGDKLVNDLVSKPANQKRLIYVNWGNWKWHRDNNWAARDNSNDKHAHVHASGEANEDENTTPWELSDWGTQPSPAPIVKLELDGELGPKTIAKWQEVMGTPVTGVMSPKNSSLVKAVQQKLRDTVDHRIVVDGELGPRTIGALQRYLKTPVDQKISKPRSQMVLALQRRLNENRF